MAQRIAGLILLICTTGFDQKAIAQKNPHLIVLGTAQDGGFPQAGCNKICCTTARQKPHIRQMVSSLALVDPAGRQWWLFDATPDLPQQLELFARLTNRRYPTLPAGIFLTHAHMGHYSGLLQLGREVMNTNGIPVYVLPRMKTFLASQAPWIQLTTAGNIHLSEIKAGVPIELTGAIRITALLVPHRDEFSETAGFRLETSTGKFLFIPDIDKWEKWDRTITEEVKQVDVAFLDATFHSAGELPNRDIREIPHPLVPETMELFSGQPLKERSKVHFIHLNHTNPLLRDNRLLKQIFKSGFRVARQGEVY